MRDFDKIRERSTWNVETPQLRFAGLCAALAIAAAFYGGVSLGASVEDTETADAADSTSGIMLRAATPPAAIDPPVLTYSRTLMGDADKRPRRGLVAASIAKPPAPKRAKTIPKVAKNVQFMSAEKQELVDDEPHRLPPLRVLTTLPTRHVGPATPPNVVNVPAPPFTAPAVSTGAGPIPPKFAAPAAPPKAPAIAARVEKIAEAVAPKPVAHKAPTTAKEEAAPVKTAKAAAKDPKTGNPKEAQSNAQVTRRIHTNLARPPRRLKNPKEANYTLQVKAFRSQPDAEQFTIRLRETGYNAFVVRSEIPDQGIWYRVRVGQFPTLADATKYQIGFEGKEGISTFVSPL
jgi:cell division septation protein DedD